MTCLEKKKGVLKIFIRHVKCLDKQRIIVISTVMCCIVITQDVLCTAGNGARRGISEDLTITYHNDVMSLMIIKATMAFPHRSHPPS